MNMVEQIEVKKIAERTVWYCYVAAFGCRLDKSSGANLNGAAISSGTGLEWDNLSGLFKSLASEFNLGSYDTAFNMIIDQSCGLHKCIYCCWTDEFPALFF